ncbi:MAG: ferritin-like fold-containing protein [Gordonia sp. (in: high G+C Gram-positive bacteria)]|uniref:ferritin-like fold-containing protein n=1 Tax=Gordonia sp. (in: high G+C Gram-positive bacteria) TaxID=84139 RepID=UPI003BB5FCFE
MSNTPEPPETSATVTLYEIFLAGEYAAVRRFIDDAAMAPSTADRVALMRVIAEEVGHLEVLSERVRAAGGEPVAAIDRHSGVFDRYHRTTSPRNWLEALVKLYIGDGLAADFTAELRSTLPPSARDVLQRVASDSASMDWARDEVRAAVAADPDVAGPLTLWGRRLLGEAITHMQWVLAEDPEVTDLLFTGVSAIANAAVFFDAMAQRHGERMADLSLA